MLDVVDCQFQLEVLETLMFFYLLECFLERRFRCICGKGF